jgi:hypothetical protein
MRAKYRKRLPQLDGGLFLTDGGLETTLVCLPPRSPQHENHVRKRGSLLTTMHMLAYHVRTKGQRQRAWEENG